MQLSQEILDKIKIIYDAIKEHCNWIYVGGSFGIKHLKFYRDIDIFIVCPNTNEREIVFRTIRKDNLELKTIVKSLQDDYNVMVLTTTVFDQQRFYDGSYQFHYKEISVLFGDPIHFAKEILLNKKDYIDVLNYSIERAYYFEEKTGEIPKNTYHIVTGVYMLQNDSYDLTPEQIENINICHDGEDQNKMKVLLKQCEEWLATQK